MLSIIAHQDPAFPAYVAKVLKVDGFGKHKTLAVSDGKEIVMIAVYHRYDGYQCEVALVARKPTWASRRILSMICGYPFIQLGCNRVTTVIRTDNHKSISLVERLGFKRETTEEGLRQFCQDGSNAHIYGMLKSECRWIKEKI